MVTTETHCVTAGRQTQGKLCSPHRWESREPRHTNPLIQPLEAEASLGWLNWQANLQLTHPKSPAAIIGPLLDDLDDLLSRSGIEIVHLKVFDRAPTGYLKASLCRNGDEPVVDGALDASAAERHEILLNLRASGDPALLEAIVIQATGRLPGKITVLNFESFRPAPPKPEHRSSAESLSIADSL